MVYFFYGKNSYLINNKINSLKERFLASDQSDINLLKLDGEDLSYDKFDQAVSAIPFLGEYRLLIIKNLLIKNKDNELKQKIAIRIKKISKEIVLFFVEEGEPDKRSALFKELNVRRRVKKFEMLSLEKLTNWIVEKMTENGIKIGKDVARTFAESVGSDMYRLENEIKKISYYISANGRNEAVLRDINLMVRANYEPDIFKFIEYLSNKDSKMAFLLKNQFINLGESENYLFSMIVYQYRNLIKVAELIKMGKKTDEIVSISQLHPYVVKKILPIVKNYSFSDLLNIYSMLYKTDLNIKNGRIGSSLAIDKILVNICLK